MKKAKLNTGEAERHMEEQQRIGDVFDRRRQHSTLINQIEGSLKKVGSHKEYYKRRKALKSHGWLKQSQELFSENSDKTMEGLEETHVLQKQTVTKAEVKELILKMQTNEASGCGGIPTDFRNIFCIGRD